MNDFGSITLVTPPSIIDNTNKTFCLVNFNEDDKTLFMKYIDKFYKNPKESLTVYIADKNDSQFNSKWLLDVIEKSSDVIIKSSQGYKFLNSNNVFEEFKKVKQMETFFNGW